MGADLARDPGQGNAADLAQHGRRQTFGHNTVSPSRQRQDSRSMPSRMRGPAAIGRFVIARLAAAMQAAAGPRTAAPASRAIRSDAKVPMTPITGPPRI